MPGGRQALQIAEAPSAHAVQHDAGTVPRQMGASGRLPDGGAELRGGALAARQENGPRPAAAAAKIAGSSGGGGERLARVRANPFDHGAQAVGTLRRQMLAKSEFVEHRDRVGGQNLLWRMTGKQRQQDRDQSAHDMCVAVAEIFQQRLAIAAAVELLR